MTDSSALSGRSPSGAVLRLSSSLTWFTRGAAPQLLTLTAVVCLAMAGRAFLNHADEQLPWLLGAVLAVLLVRAAWHQAPYLWDAAREGGELIFWRGSESFRVSAAMLGCTTAVR